MHVLTSTVAKWMQRNPWDFYNNLRRNKNKTKSRTSIDTDYWIMYLNPQNWAIITTEGQTLTFCTCMSKCIIRRGEYLTQNLNTNRKAKFNAGIQQIQGARIESRQTSNTDLYLQYPSLCTHQVQNKMPQTEFSKPQLLHWIQHTWPRVNFQLKA